MGDAFLTQLSSSGEHLGSTYLGKSREDWGYSVAKDTAQGVYVAGITESTGWISGGWDTSYGGGNGDAFLAKLTLNEPPGAPEWFDLPSPNKLYPSTYPETPDDTNGPYVVTVDYTDPDGRDDLRHVYLRLTGAGTPQTIRYDLLATPIQSEGDHLENLGATKTIITNGYRVTYRFQLNGSWTPSKNVDFEAWSVDAGEC